MSALSTVWYQVPVCADATRAPHSDAAWTALETGMLAAYGGYTRGPDVAGAWRDPSGRVVSEPSRTYEIDVPADAVPAVRFWLSEVCFTFGQQVLRAKVDGRVSYVEPVAKAATVAA